MGEYVIKLSNKDKSIEMRLPVKIEYQGKEYWIKKSTKTVGLYMNNQVPPREILIKENDYTSISK